MIVACCQHESRKKNDTTKSGTVRWRCNLCGKSWTESTATLGGMRIGLDMAAKVIGLLCDGVSIATTCRATGLAKHTVLDLLLYVGPRCEKFMAENIKNVFVDDIQCDEIWQWIFCKKATAKRMKYVGGCGDSFCYTAIDKQTKLLVTWHLGRRDENHTRQFIAKLDAATHGHFHVSTDGWRSYQPAIRQQLGHRVDHGVMTKIFGKPIDYPRQAYSPAHIIGAARTPILGDAYQQDKICTSHMERHNLSIRTHVRRMGRLSICFSKRWENHRCALAMYFCHYNYCRKHRTLRGMTPAMAHGLTTEVWSVRKLLEAVLS